MNFRKTIGRYEIIQELGRGAMGLVYLAHDPKIDRRVAIKTIHTTDKVPPEEAEETTRRFMREAQAAGRLQHPGIVTIFDVGEQDGNYFIAMEYIEGQTLELFTSSDSLLPLGTAIDLVKQACAALDYAHRNDVVHRDIKPANLMLLRDGTLKITDFGLAKNPSTSLTQDGVLIGTPNYMSPEQVTGRPLDGRSDLFSLAAVTYELLTGVRPFAGDSVTTIIYRIANEPPRLPQSVNERIPPDLGRVLMRALSKEPPRRYQTGADFARALEEHALPATAAAASPVSPRPAKAAPAPAAPSARRQRQAPAAGGEGLRTTLALIAALLMVVLFPRSTTPDDRWGRAADSGQPPFYLTAGIVSGTIKELPPRPSPPGPSGASEVPEVAVPGSTASALVEVSTEPPGGRIYLDDVEAPGGIVRLPEDDDLTHTLVAESDCFIEKMDYRLAEGRSITIPLKTPKPADLSVTSSPPGARIALDGRDTGKVTPATLSVAACGEKRIALSLSGYQSVERSIDRPEEGIDVTLQEIPKGYVRISSTYPVAIYEGKRRLGESGESIRLTSGRHRLRLLNEELFVDRTITVTVEGDKTVAPRAGLPEIGSLTVLTSPGNCRIFIDDREIGAPPINDFPLAAGTYTVRAVYVPTDEEQSRSVTVSGDAGARVTFKFNP